MENRFSGFLAEELGKRVAGGHRRKAPLDLRGVKPIPWWREDKAELEIGNDGGPASARAGLGFMELRNVRVVKVGPECQGHQTGVTKLGGSEEKWKQKDNQRRSQRGRNENAKRCGGNPTSERIWSKGIWWRESSNGEGIRVAQENNHQWRRHEWQKGTKRPTRSNWGGTKEGRTVVRRFKMKPYHEKIWERPWVMGRATATNQKGTVALNQDFSGQGLRRLKLHRAWGMGAFLLV